MAARNVMWPCVGGHVRLHDVYDTMNIMKLKYTIIWQIHGIRLDREYWWIQFLYPAKQWLKWWQAMTSVVMTSKHVNIQNSDVQLNYSDVPGKLVVMQAPRSACTRLYGGTREQRSEVPWHWRCPSQLISTLPPDGRWTTAERRADESVEVKWWSAKL